MNDVVIRSSRPSDMPAVADLRWRWSVDEDGRQPVQTPDAYRTAMTAFGLAHQESHRCVVAGLQTISVHPELRGLGFGDARLLLQRPPED